MMPARALCTALPVGMCLGLGGSAAVADIICQMQPRECEDACAPTEWRFFIDTSQFVRPQAVGDPPRRQMTTVTTGGDQFAAEAILMDGGIRGFHQTTSDGSRLMIVQRNGTARMALEPDNIQLEGACRDQ